MCNFRHGSIVDVPTQNTIKCSTCVHPRILVGFVLLTFLVFCVVLLCVFTFWVRCCDVRYDFNIKAMFGSSLPPVAFRMAHVYLRYTSKCYTSMCYTSKCYTSKCYTSMCYTSMCLFAHSGVQHILCSVVFCFSSSCVPVMLPVSLDCQILIAPSVFFNVYLSTEKQWIVISKFIWKSGKYNNFFLVYYDVCIYWLIKIKLGYIYDWVEFYNANK